MGTHFFDALRRLEWTRSVRGRRAHAERRHEKNLVHLSGHKTVDLPADPGRPTGHLALGPHGGTVHTQFKDLAILSD